MKCPYCFADEFSINELSKESEICDTYGGDYTYRDLCLCQSCGTLFYSYYGSETGEEEIDEKDVSYLIHQELNLQEEILEIIKKRYQDK